MTEAQPPTRTCRRGCLARLALACACAALLPLALAPGAWAAGDPVETGTVTLRLSGAFKKQLRRNGVKLNRRAFSIAEGEVNPITGRGELTLKGQLRFKHRGRKVVYRKLEARVGSAGVLKGTGRKRFRPERNPTKLFRLRGGKVTRNGFGAVIGDVRVRLRRKAAKRISRRLGLHSLRRVRAGSLSVSAQPETVEVTGGTVRLTPFSSTADGSGTVVSKFDDHCIDFVDGNTAVPPGVKDSTDVANPYYVFPVTGGTVGPDGADGAIDQAGGIRLVNDPGLGGNCASVSSASLERVDSSYNLLDRYISARVLVAGPAPPLGGEHLDAIGANLNMASATVSANPAAHTVTINGIVATNNAGSALFLNQTFPQPAADFDEAFQFAFGDLFATIDLAVTTR